MQEKFVMTWRKIALPALAAFVGCVAGSGQSKLEIPRTIRLGLQSELLGCWQIEEATGSEHRERVWWLPLRMQLDSSLVSHVLNVRGYRAAWRLDSVGQRVVRDAEGFVLTDSWAADSVRNRIVIGLGNGLYGATLVLAHPGRSRMDTLRGRGMEYGDVVPAPVVPVVPLIAVRVPCAPTTARE